MSLQLLIEKYCFVYWNKTMKLHNSNCHLNVALFPKELYTSSIDSRVYICSIHNELIFILLNFLKCSIDFQIAPENFGGRYVNGSWNGILSLFESKISDFIPHDFSILNNRSAIMNPDFLMPEYDLLTMLSFPKYLSTSGMWNIFTVFSSTIWLLIFLHFLFYGLFNAIANMQYAEKSISNFVNAFIDVFGMLVGQGDAFLSSKFNPLIVWVLMALVLRQCFSSDITALLLSKREVQIDYFTQLDQYDFKLVIEEKSNSLHYFQLLFPQYGHRVVTLPHDALASEELMSELVASNYVLITDGLNADMIQHFYSTMKFHISREKIVSSLGNYAIRKSLNRQLKQRLSHLIKQLFWFGIESKIEQLVPLNSRYILRNLNIVKNTNQQPGTTKESLFNSKSDSLETQLSLSLTYTTIYLIGISLAIVCLLLEWLVHLIKGSQ